MIKSHTLPKDRKIKESHTIQGCMMSIKEIGCEMWEYEVSADVST